MLLKFSICVIFLSVCEVLDSHPTGSTTSITHNTQQVRTPSGISLIHTVYRNDTEVFKINIAGGADFPQVSWGTCGKNCWDFEAAYVDIQEISEGHTRMVWTVRDPNTTLSDCVHLKNQSWFGGPEQKEQYWPIDELKLNDFAYITKEDGNCAVIEPYWLSEVGAYIHIDSDTPLFVTQNRTEDTEKDRVCFTAKIDGPYIQRKNFTFTYDIVVKENVKEAHKHAVKTFFGKPTGIPNAKMFEEPIWSTWAKFKRDVNTTVVDTFAKEILANNFTGQFELDDDWEICYGALEFRKSKFEDPKAVVQKLHDQGFRVTLWVHPFINTNCDPYFKDAKEKGYLVTNENGEVETQWWNSGKGEASLVDFTNEEARKWWAERLWKLKNETGLDSYKFDAGETSWAPQIPVFFGGKNETFNKVPNSFTTEYVKTCAQFGDLIEVRSAYKSQELPIFVRIVDKDTRWGFENGLRTLITTLLQMNLAGYPLVLPDMVGGNLYGNDTITGELFIRWLQANTFMPSVQFSLVPWDFKDEKIDVLGISQKFVKLHAEYTPVIIEEAKTAIKEGIPLNAPVWWVAPEDPQTYRINDQFLLGDKILAAPVVVEGAVKRDVYLPSGKWKDGNNGSVYEGGRTLKDYPAPIDVLPFFVRQ
ncbi:myogenesis-regulating glycosidase-like isoform X2 [Chrysoperla carnea]|uniref:myogenesis-regulating glycosidase-like isoform X2 n=1 Tax=Chrysoperla carnea TaxID=189513 RepID=UPI001D07B8AE|nr:myogenesis-regulating glycosidase-like isoform X2 [Chrysoperla carnea]